MIKRVIGLLLHPTEEWDNILIENKSNKKIFISYTFWLFLFQIVCNLCNAFIYIKISNDNYIQTIIKSIILPFAGIFYILFASFIISSFASIFNAEKNIKNSLTVILYSHTVVIYSSLLNLFHLKYIGYSSILLLIYLRYFGVKVLLKSKRLPFIYGIIPEILIIIISSLLIFFGKLLQTKFLP